MWSGGSNTGRVWAHQRDLCEGGAFFPYSSPQDFSSLPTKRSVLYETLNMPHEADNLLYSHISKFLINLSIHLWSSQPCTHLYIYPYLPIPPSTHPSILIHPSIHPIHSYPSLCPHIHLLTHLSVLIPITSEFWRNSEFCPHTPYNTLCLALSAWDPFPNSPSLSFPSQK